MKMQHASAAIRDKLRTSVNYHLKVVEKNYHYYYYYY